MANKIIHKHSSVVTDGKAKLPISSQLEYGELAVNYAKDNETISLKNSENEIVEFKSKDYFDEKINNINTILDSKSDKTHKHDLTSITTGTITLTGDVTGTITYNGTNAISATTTVDNNSHTHTSANITDSISLNTDITSATTALVQGKAVKGYVDSAISTVNDSISSLQTTVNSKAASSHNHGKLILTGDATGNVTITSGTGDMTLTVAVKDDSHNHSNYTTDAEFTGHTSVLGKSGVTGHVKIITGDVNGKTYTKGEAAAAAHTHGNYLTAHQSISHLVTKDELSGYTTDAEFSTLQTTVNGKANNSDLTTHTSNSTIHVTSNDKTKWNKVDNKLDTSVFTGYTGTTKTTLEGLRTDINNKALNSDLTTLSGTVGTLRNDFNTLVSGNTDTVIESFKEVTAFLSGVTDTQSLDGIIGGISSDIDTHKKVSGGTGTTEFGHVKIITGDVNGKTYTKGEAAAAAHTHSNYLTAHQSISHLATKDELSGYTTDAEFSALQTTVNDKANNSDLEIAASKINTKISKPSTTIGSATQPVYITSGGSICACTAYSYLATKAELSGYTTDAEFSALQTTVNGKAASSHKHTASDITGGTFDLARIPTGTSSSTVALGDHSHRDYITGNEFDDLQTTVFSNLQTMSSGLEAMGSDLEIAASKINTKISKPSTTIGSATQPVYITSGGSICACTAYSSASVSSATNATNVYVTSNSTNTTHYLTFASGNTSGNKALRYDSNLYYNPSSNTLTVSGGTINTSKISASTITASTSMYSAAFYETSDERLKNFQDKIPVDLDKLSKLKKNYFTWKEKERGEKLEIGVSAQEIKELYPEIVSDEGKTLSVAYDKLSVIALSAVDVLYEENKSLKNKVSELEEEIKNINEFIKTLKK